MGTLLHPTCDSLKGGLIERVYIPKGPLNPNSQWRMSEYDFTRDLWGYS